MSEETKEQTDENKEVDSESSTDSDGEKQSTDEAVVDKKETDSKELSPAEQRIRELTDQTQRLERLLEASLASRPSQQRTVTRPEPKKLGIPDRDLLTPTERVLADAVEQLQSESSAYRGVLGTQADELDKLDTLNDAKLATAYRKHRDTVEQYRKDRAEYGVYLTRKEALGIILLENGESLAESVVDKRPAQKPPAKPKSSSSVQKSSQEGKSLAEKLAGAKF